MKGSPTKSLLLQHSWQGSLSIGLEVFQRWEAGISQQIPKKATNTHTPPSRHRHLYDSLLQHPRHKTVYFKQSAHLGILPGPCAGPHNLRPLWPLSFCRDAFSAFGVLMEHDHTITELPAGTCKGAQSVHEARWYRPDLRGASAVLLQL